MFIDLNADVGEGLDGADAAMVPVVTSANIACGGHAGDEATMRRTVELALRHGTTIGAHPGYPDRAGFGRRAIQISPAALVASLATQLADLRVVVVAAGATVAHVKPHGALYTQAAADRSLADLIAGTVHAFDADVLLVGLAGSALLEAGRAIGQPVAAEAFADRAYAEGGTLFSRRDAGAVIEEPERVASQAVSIARDGRVPLGDGRWIDVEADTICLHGDSPSAVENVMAVRAALRAAGVELAGIARRA